MSAADLSELESARQRFAGLLDIAARQGRKLTFWWRDDDTEDATPALDRLLDLAARHELPLALAVVPKRATEALAARLKREARVFVLQHGWRHRNYAPEGEKKTELGSHRPADAVLDELSRGFDRLRARFPDKFLPVLVPPWNRIAAEVRDQRRLTGLIGLSAIGPVEPRLRHCVNVHIDVLDWKPPRPMAPERVYSQFCAETERRLAGSDEPIGLMTHHLVQEEPSWTLLADLTGMIARHPAVAWPPISDLFGMQPPSA
jgi:hypothetical protein